MKNKIRFVILTALLFTLVFSGCKEIPEMDDTIAATVGARSVSREELISRIKHHVIVGKPIIITELIKDSIQEQEVIARLKGTEYESSKTYADYYREAREGYEKNEEENQKAISRYPEKYGISYSKEESIYSNARFTMYIEAYGKYISLYYDAHGKELENMTPYEAVDVIDRHLEETFRPDTKEIQLNQKVLEEILADFEKIDIAIT